MAADPYDEGRGRTTAAGARGGRRTCGYGPMPSTNPTKRSGGRGDGTESIRDSDPTAIPHATNMRGAAGAVNPTAKTGRPDADMNAPRRAYDRLKASSSTNDIVDVSANKRNTTKSAKEL
jgi:hypothetical protein